MPRCVRSPIVGDRVVPCLLAFMVLVALMAPAAHLPAVGASQVTASPDATPTVDDDLYADVLPDERASVEAATGAVVSSYQMDIRVDPMAGTIGGTETIRFVNRYGEPLSDIYLRLFPNADYYGPGGTIVDDVTLDGRATPPRLSVEDKVLDVPLERILAPGATVALSLRFTTTVPVDSTGSYGTLSRDSRTGSWALADWYPSLAGYEPHGRGWRLDPPLDNADPTFGDVALYDLHLTTPAGMQVVASGHTVDTAPSADSDDVHVVAGPVRDLTLGLGRNWRPTTRQVGETTVRYWTDAPDGAATDRELDVVASSLAQYGQRFGIYPYRDLDLIDVPLTTGTLGVSWSNIVFLDGSALAANDSLAFDQYLLAHEIAHQWWGNLVGGNSNDHPFIPEGMANATMVLDVEWQDGWSAALDMLTTRVVPGYLGLLNGPGDGVADQPFAGAPDSLGVLIYGKATLGLLAIRFQIGDEAFFTALHTYASIDGGFAFRIAKPDDLLAAFEAASGQRLGALWNAWFEQATTTPADVQALLAAYAAHGS